MAALPGLICTMLCAFSLTTKAAEPLEPQPAPVAPADTLRQISVSVKRIPDSVNIHVEPITATTVISTKVNDSEPDTVRQVFSVTSGTRKPDPNAQPIYVIDGVIHTSASMTKKSLNAADYESITVLKGSASTAVYGDKGKDGAIVITTKKSIRPERVAISDGEIHEIRVGQSSIVGVAGSFDRETVKKVDVTLSKKEKRKGVTVSSKLLESYPELFELSPDGSVQNRIPVSVTINEEK